MQKLWSRLPERPFGFLWSPQFPATLNEAGPSVQTQKPTTTMNVLDITAQESILTGHFAPRVEFFALGNLDWMLKSDFGVQHLSHEIREKRACDQKVAGFKVFSTLGLTSSVLSAPLSG